MPVPYRDRKDRFTLPKSPPNVPAVALLENGAGPVDQPESSKSEANQSAETVCVVADVALM